MNKRMEVPYQFLPKDVPCYRYKIQKLPHFCHSCFIPPFLVILTSPLSQYMRYSKTRNAMQETHVEIGCVNAPWKKKVYKTCVISIPFVNPSWTMLIEGSGADFVVVVITLFPDGEEGRPELTRINFESLKPPFFSFKQGGGEFCQLPLPLQREISPYNHNSRVLNPLTVSEPTNCFDMGRKNGSILRQCVSRKIPDVHFCGNYGVLAELSVLLTERIALEHTFLVRG